ncbi:MAG: DUF2076 domain-containing protein [Proteobacteria bacterium]|nr:DUF2076 domain-containing protein [Pseudomonadota bacterium]MBI3499459.1 DUF2076 domain-containing protein [Pseudomonadota bacterium]
MTPEERALITGLFAKLKTADTAEKDREAEDLIRRLVAEQPSVSYLLTQTVLVQEQALAGAQARIAELEAKAKAAASSSGAGTSFLGGAAKSGPWGSFTSAQRPAAPMQAQAAPAMPPMPGQPMAAPAAGGGFLHAALATAAGVAGGALLFEGIRGLMGHSAGPFSSALGTTVSQPGVTEITNNYYGDSAAAGRNAPGVVDTAYQPDDPASAGLTDASYQSDSDDNAGGFDSSDDSA